MLYPKNKSEKLSKELFKNPTSEYRGAWRSCDHGAGAWFSGRVYRGARRAQSETVSFRFTVYL